MDTKVANWISDAFYPSVSNLINHYFNKDNVLVIEVKSGEEKPYYIELEHHIQSLKLMKIIFLLGENIQVIFILETVMLIVLVLFMHL